MRKPLDLLSIAAMAVTVLAFAATAPLTAVATSPALVMAAGRNVLGFLTLGPLVLWRRRAQLTALLTRRSMRRPLAYSVLAGTCLAAHFATFMPSTRLTSVAMATALVSTQPVWQAVISAAQGERIAPRAWLGLAVAVAGAAVAGGGDYGNGGKALLGDLLALLGAIALAAYTAFSARARTHIGTPVHSVICSLVCSLELIIVCLATGTGGPRLDGRTVLALLGLLVLPQLLGLVSLNFSLGRAPATVVSVALLMEAPLAAFIAWAAMGQVPSGTAWLGLAMITGGVTVVVVGDARAGRGAVAALPDEATGNPAVDALPIITLDRTAIDELHGAIFATAHAGRHAEAARTARALHTTAVRGHGLGSPQAIHWTEVRAVLARIADDPALACELWLSAAHFRLGLRGADHNPAEVRACLDRALHEWSRVKDNAAISELARPLLLLYGSVADHRPEAAEAIRRRLRRRGINSPAIPA
ncbi:DMT family transporter [Streptomyces sp. NBC_00328]|uniref:DMT family transporter n=1 Tax=Streptomyces sp. NBC_00328 TaxID=2903646 RepID=UPI002E294469|nr:DMT family transporter [Streptomyces sp. NBC_00328]